MQQICKCLKQSNCTRLLVSTYTNSRLLAESPLHPAGPAPGHPIKFFFFLYFPCIVITVLVPKFHIALYTYHADLSMQRILPTLLWTLRYNAASQRKYQKSRAKYEYRSNSVFWETAHLTQLHLVYITELYTAWKLPLPQEWYVCVCVVGGNAWKNIQIYFYPC